MKNFKFLTCIIIMSLSGCSSGDVKETLGLRRSSPDEFNVISNPPLYIPPDFNLPDPNAANAASTTILDTPQERSTKAIKLDALDVKFLNSLGQEAQGGEVKKMIDEEYIENLKKKKGRGIIRKTVEKLNASDDKEYIDPVLEKERINKNLKENKPINEGTVPVKKPSTLDKILN